MKHPPLPAAAILPPPPPGHREGVHKEENNKTEVVPQLPRAAGTPAASACPVTMGGRGKKGLRNLAEELNGVERRGEGLGRGGLGGGGRSAIAGGRRARRSKSASQTLQQSPELGRRRWRRRRRRPGGGTTRPRARPPARARRWPRVRRCARQRCWSEAGARRGAREAGAEGRLRGVSLEPAVRSRGGLGECVDCELFQNSVLRTHYFNIWKKHIQRCTPD